MLEKILWVIATILTIIVISFAIFLIVDTIVDSNAANTYCKSLGYDSGYISEAGRVCTKTYYMDVRVAEPTP